MSFDLLRFGIANNWPLGETPYNVEFNANLDIATAYEGPLMIDYRREPPSNPDYSLPEDAPFIKINNANGNIEYWAWVFDMDLGFDVLELQKTVVPTPGMIVGVKADESYAMFTPSGWKHLWEFRQPGAVEIAMDCDFPRANKMIASLFVTEPLMIFGGAESRCFPRVNKTPDLYTQFSLRKNGVPFGTVSIPGFNLPVTSPTIAIPQTFFEPGDRLSYHAPESIHGITGLNITLRFTGNI